MTMAALAARLRHFGRRSRLLGAAALLGLLASLAPAQAQVVVFVNGEPITALDIAQRSKLIQMSTQKTPARQTVIDELINERIKIREGKRYSIDPTKAEVDRAFETMAKRMGASEDKLEQILASAGSSAQTLKTRIKADLVWSQLVRGKFQSSLQVQEKDILAAAPDTDANAKGVEYTLRPVLVVVPRGSGEGVSDSKRREAEGLRARFQNCEQGIPFARQLRDVAVREQIVRSSADLTPQLRKVLDDMEVGRLTAPEVTANGIEMFALCARKSTNSDDTPGMREAKNKIFAERFDAKAKKFLADIRKTSMIEYKK
jgi:peptidyl-prolyl cis-trans isomerase SurA